MDDTGETHVKAPAEGLLEKTVRVHESEFGADKLIKTAGFAFGLLANYYTRAAGPEGVGISPTAKVHSPVSRSSAQHSEV